MKKKEKKKLNGKFLKSVFSKFSYKELIEQHNKSDINSQVPIEEELEDQ